MIFRYAGGVKINNQQSINQDLINTENNIITLKQYLHRDAIHRNLTDQQARKFVDNVIHKHRNNLFGVNSVAQSLAKRSFTFFCLYYLQDYFVPKSDNLNRELAPVHYEIWTELESMFIDNTHDKQQFILPRGSAKSTIINVAVSAWLPCFQLSTYTLVLSNLQADAEDFVENTKRAFNSPYIINTFGKLVQHRKRTVNKLEVELDNDTKIKAYSSTTSVRGTSYTSPKGRYRPNTIIADDYISENDILTDDSKNKKYIRWQKEVEDSGDTAVYRKNKLIKPTINLKISEIQNEKNELIECIKDLYPKILSGVYEYELLDNKVYKSYDVLIEIILKNRMNKRE